jgi:SAM-dependent methyltransferase
MRFQTSTEKAHGKAVGIDVPSGDHANGQFIGQSRERPLPIDSLLTGEDVENLYQTMLQRPPEGEFVKETLLKGGHTLRQLIEQIQTSEEFLSKIEQFTAGHSRYMTREEPARYRARLIADIIAENPGADQAYRQIQDAIAELPEKAHAILHEVRYLTTYTMTPSGPGVIVDVGASPVYGLPLTMIKGWTIEPIPSLAFDYEKDTYPYADASVDGVLLCEVIEHFVLDPLHCIIEINRILKPDGFLILTTPNAASWFTIYQALDQRHPSRWPVYTTNSATRANHIHAREYLTSEVRMLLEAGGFGDIGLITRDYGVSPPYRPISGFGIHDRGETIFCRARKKGLPKKRAFAPLYLQDVDFGPTV